MLSMVQFSELESSVVVCIAAPTKPDKWTGCCTFIQSNWYTWGIIAEAETNIGVNIISQKLGATDIQCQQYTIHLTWDPLYVTPDM